MGALMSVASDYEWPRPPEGGWTAEDLDRLPNLPPHTELIDGSLVFMSPQTDFHYLAIRLLEFRLLQAVPPELDIRCEMTVTLGRHNRPEPDVMVIRKQAVDGPRRTTFAPEDVLLAIEVVSAESVERDRMYKPLKYAQAGIPSYWRVESDGGKPVVYTFALEPASGCYVPVGIFHDTLTVSVPFPVSLDLADIDKNPFQP